MRIATKAEFYRLWHAGLLGNKPRTWGTFEELLASGYHGSVTIRTIGQAGGKTRYNVPFGLVLAEAMMWPGTPTFNESAPDEVLVVQGEVMRSDTGIVLYYDTAANTKMNEARLRFKEARGVIAVSLLRHYLWPSSFEDIADLLDLYDGHVIEFSAYDRSVGDQPHRNALIWEIRHY